jgi:hypothetical protein
MAGDKPRDRRVIGALLGRDHAKRDVLHARPLDHPRRRHPTRIGIQQQRHHHRRVIRRPAAPIDAIRRIERIEVHLGHRVDDKPRQMTGRQPLANIRRQQERLLAIARHEALSHPPSLLT